MSKNAGERGIMEKEENMSETIKTIIYAIVIAVLIRSFLFEPFKIPSGSMYPNLYVGDFCLFPNTPTVTPNIPFLSACRCLKGGFGVKNRGREMWWCLSSRKTTVPILLKELSVCRETKSNWKRADCM